MFGMSVRPPRLKVRAPESDPLPRPTPALIVSALTTAALTLAGCHNNAPETAAERETIEVPTTVTVTADPTDLPSSFTHYVALGDSYAAMGSASGRFEGPDFCARSQDNYPHQLADMYSGINAKRGFTDATCQGATTKHILSDRDHAGEDVPEQVQQAKRSATPGSTTENAPASTRENPREAASTSGTLAAASTPATEQDVIIKQIDALEPDTDLITLSVGGNDINFGPWSRCITGELNGRGEADCDPGLYDDTARALVDLPTRLDAIYAAIHDKAPDATIITTGYMPLLSLEDECERTADLPGGTLNWAAGLTMSMNALVRDAAARNGALFVTPSNAEFHSVCAPPDQRWTDLTGEETDSFPAHPTPAGQHAMAEAIADTLLKL